MSWKNNKKQKVQSAVLRQLNFAKITITESNLKPALYYSPGGEHEIRNVWMD
jgi:hypothetical protein